MNAEKISQIHNSRNFEKISKKIRTTNYSPNRSAVMSSTIGGATTRTGTSANTRGGKVSDRHIRIFDGGGSLPKKRILRRSENKGVNKSMNFKKNCCKTVDLKMN